MKGQSIVYVCTLLLCLLILQVSGWTLANGPVKGGRTRGALQPATIVAPPNPPPTTVGGGGSGPTGRESLAQIIARHQAKKVSLKNLGAADKIKDTFFNFDTSLQTTVGYLGNVKTLTGKSADKSKGKAAIIQYHRNRVAAALLNARHATVNNPTPFTALNSMSLWHPTQFKKLLNSRKGKVKLPVGVKDAKRSTTPKLKGAAATTPTNKSKPINKLSASASTGKKQDHSFIEDPVQGINKPGAGGIASGAGTDASQSGKKGGQSGKKGGDAGFDASQSGKKGGDSGFDASQSGKKGGDSGADASQSGKKGGTDGNDASQSGKKGGTDGNDASQSGKKGGTDGFDGSQSGKKGGDDGSLGSQSGKKGGDGGAAGSTATGTCPPGPAPRSPASMNIHSPDYKKMPGDMVMADGHVINNTPVPPPQQFNPTTGKCFTPIFTQTLKGPMPGRCPTCPFNANPALIPMPCSTNPCVPQPWGPDDIHPDENGQICYGPKCVVSEGTGSDTLIIPYAPMIANGILRDMSSNPQFQYTIDHIPSSASIFQRNQGDGSTCWANAAVQVAEIAQQILRTRPDGTHYHNFAGPLSARMVVQCVPNEGASGGSPIDALNWMLTHVVPTMDKVHPDQQYPCPPAVPLLQGTIDSVVTPIPTCDHGDCSGQNQYEAQLLTATQTMPVLVYVDASKWQSYSQPGGVRNGDIASVAYPTSACSNDPTLGNHVVLIDSQQRDIRTGKMYWRILNSWGPDWGVRGEIYLEAGVNACGLANYPVGVPSA